MNYAQHFNPSVTPQTEKADPRQKENHAGGFTFTVDNWTRLHRFLILGSDGNTYYQAARALTRENGECVVACLKEDPARAVEVIASVSEAGRAPKNDPAVFALALAAADPNPAARRLALAALPRVCRIGTHLFHFAAAVDSFRGWGTGLRKGIGAWYSRQSARDLMHQATKYQQRDGWSHRDLLRLCHIEPTPELGPVLRWIATGADAMGEREVAGSEKARRAAREYGAHALPAYLEAFEELKMADEKRTIALIGEHGFTHEMIATERKNSADVWGALLEKMPPGALVRNLAKMTAVGLLKPMSPSIAKVCGRLTDEAALKKARLHPIAMLSALLVYRRGHGEKGKLSWSPVAQVVDALDAGFYAAFGAVEPTGKRIVFGIDVSGSMCGGEIAGVPGLDPRTAAAAMAMVTARVEKTWHALGFSHRLIDLPISPRQRLDDVVRTMSGIPFGSTDAALPVLWAAGNNVDVDAFVVLTDNETYFGHVHPHQALKAYRAKSGIPARLAAIAFTATEFSIADPTDPLQMNFAGFDSAAPSVLADFVKGE